jgi:hypothetical protein
MPRDDVFSREMRGVAGHALLHCTEGKAPWEREKGGEEMEVPRRCTTGQNNFCCFRCGGSGDRLCLSLGSVAALDRVIRASYGATVYLLADGCSIRPYPVAVSLLPRWAWATCMLPGWRHMHGLKT